MGQFSQCSFLISKKGTSDSRVFGSEVTTLSREAGVSRIPLTASGAWWVPGLRGLGRLLLLLLSWELARLVPWGHWRCVATRAGVCSVPFISTQRVRPWHRGVQFTTCW